MKNKLTILLFLIIINFTFSQQKIKADVDIINFLGRNPGKTESNVLTDNLLRMLYYSIQPENYPKIGYLNKKGEVIINPKFNMASEFYDNYANIIKDSTYGYVDKNGVETYFKEYDYAFFYYSNTGLASKNGKVGLINRKGDSITEFKYNIINLFGFNHFICRPENKRGHIINSDGKIVFNENLEYDIKNYSFGKDSIFIYQEIIDKKKLNGIVNINGKVITQPIYQDIQFINDGDFYVVKKENQYGCIDKSGNVVIPIIYDKIDYYLKKGLILAMKNGKWGYINQKNETIIPFQYDEACPFFNDLAFVKKGDFYGTINVKNKIKFKFSHEKTKFPFFTENLALFKENGKYGFINKKGKTKIPAIYDKAFPYINGLAYVEINGKVGYIDTKGKEIIPIKYNQLWFESDEMIRFAE